MLKAYDSKKAKEIGLKQAIILYTLKEEFLFKQKTDSIQYQGLTWIPFSMVGYEDLFSEMGVDRVATAINYLLDNKHIKMIERNTNYYITISEDEWL